MVGVYPTTSSGSGHHLKPRSARPKGQLLEAMMEMRQGAEASVKGWDEDEQIDQPLGPMGWMSRFFFGGDTPSNRYHLFIVHPSFFLFWGGCGGGGWFEKKTCVLFCVDFFQSW